MKHSRFIEVKIPKATLFLTPAEFETALKRGKALLRARAMKQRMENERSTNDSKDTD